MKKKRRHVPRVNKAILAKPVESEEGVSTDLVSGIKLENLQEKSLRADIMVEDETLPQGASNEEEQEEGGEEKTIQAVMQEFIDEASLGLCFEVHRAAKIGILFLDDVDPECQKDFSLVQTRGLDVFGQVPIKKQMECECPNCGRPMAASRFAPHLEKCMGMGRNSSRIASRRIASAQKKEGCLSDEDEDDEDLQPKDEEWNADKKGKRPIIVKRERNGCMLKRLLKLGQRPLRNGGAHSSSPDFNILQPYETMGLDDRRQLLSQTCGVISEHTKKMCTKSMRCPQHSEHQRRAVRVFLLSTLPDSTPTDDVDVDSIHDDDNDHSLSWDHTSSPSPTDSITNSESSLPASQGKRKPSRRPHTGKKRRH